MKKYYILGVGYKSDDVLKSHPYEVWIDVQEEKYPLVMLEGKGMSAVGGSFKPAEILKESWSDHLTLSKTEWIKPLCEFVATNNELLDIDSVIECYKHLYGSYPELREIG